MAHEKRPEIVEGVGFEKCRTNATDYQRVRGLNAVTIYDGNPYFFLFADIDTKDSESLRRVLQFYKLYNLTVLFYETCKGWHVLSPSLLPIRKWKRLSDNLSKLVTDYRFDTIRLTKRHCDGKTLYFEHWNENGKDSYSMIYEFLNKFSATLPRWYDNLVTTQLEFSFYNQLRLRKM